MSSDVQLSGPASPRSPRRFLRWLIPVAAAGVFALVASDVLSADANPNLPGRTPTQLLAAAGAPKLTGFSGTVVEKAAFGLPDLGALFGGGTDQLGGPSVFSGSHTVRVWYGSQSKQRIAMLDSLGETDLFRNGSTLWEWDSRNRVATRHTLPATLSAPAGLATAAPDQAAQRIIALMSPSTEVSADKNVQVAGRAAYELVLTPKDGRSRVRQVRIALDGRTMVPLALQLYPRGSDRPALDIAYTRFDAVPPSEDNFSWQPPAGVTVKQGAAADAPKLPLALGQVRTGTVGSGWTTVFKATNLPTAAVLAKQNPQLGLLYGMLPTVKGAWGSGHLLTSALLTALVTDDGRFFAGAVDPSVLYEAAAKK